MHCRIRNSSSPPSPSWFLYLISEGFLHATCSGTVAFSRTQKQSESYWNSKHDYVTHIPQSSTNSHNYYLTWQVHILEWIARSVASPLQFKHVTQTLCSYVGKKTKQTNSNTSILPFQMLSPKNSMTAQAGEGMCHYVQFCFRLLFSRTSEVLPGPGPLWRIEVSLIFPSLQV